MNKSQTEKICFKCKKAFTSYVQIDGKYKPSCCFTKKDDSKDVTETNKQNGQSETKHIDTIASVFNLKLVEKKIETKIEPKIELETCCICLEDKVLKEFVTIHDNHKVCKECHEMEKFTKCPLCRQDKRLYQVDAFLKYFNDTDSDYIWAVKCIIYADCYDYKEDTNDKLNDEQRSYRDVKSYVFSWKYQRTVGFNRPMKFSDCMIGISFCYHDTKK